MRGIGRSMKESEDIKRAGESVEAVRTQIADLEGDIRAETERIAARFAVERRSSDWRWRPSAAR